MGMHPRPSHREMCPEQYSHPLAGQYVRLVLPGTAKEITTLVERVYANGRGVQEVVVLDTNGGQHFYPIENVRGIAEMKRFWISWVQPTEDYRPLNYPPLPPIIGWWCSGSCDEGAILCALVRAKGERDAKSQVKVDWPEATGWRFCDERASDWRPSDRFVIDDAWTRERIQSDDAGRLTG